MTQPQTPNSPRLCERCAAGAHGEKGHAALSLYVGGPYPGHHIFKCGDCGDRWIRHYGDANERYGWTRHAEQFPASTRKPRDDVSRKVFPF